MSKNKKNLDDELSDVDSEDENVVKIKKSEKKKEKKEEREEESEEEKVISKKKERKKIKESKAKKIQKNESESESEKKEKKMNKNLKKYIESSSDEEEINKKKIKKKSEDEESEKEEEIKNKKMIKNKKKLVDLENEKEEKKEVKKVKKIKDSSSENSSPEKNSESEKKKKKSSESEKEEEEELKKEKEIKKIRYSSGTWPEIFIKNLSYSTTEESLRNYFKKYGEVESTKIVYDKETGRSKGVGFCKFKNPSSAEKVINSGQLELDGRPIGITLSNEKPEKKQVQFKKTENFTGEKFSVFVGNLSFKSNEDGLKKLFSDCGNILDIRITKNKEGKSKGFAHIDFDSQEGMNNAISKNGFILDGRELRVDKSVSKTFNKNKKSDFNVSGKINKDVKGTRKVFNSDDSDDD